MTRVETNYVNSNTQVNPELERRIKVLEDRGNIEEVFLPHEIRELGSMGREEYLAYLYRLRTSDEAPSEE